MSLPALALAAFLSAQPSHAAVQQHPHPRLAELLGAVADGITREDPRDMAAEDRIAAARKAAAAGDVLSWGLALFPETFTVQFCPALHQHLVDQRAHDYTSDEAPRGHAKTTIACFLVPLYQALEEPDTFRHYLNVQATEEKALAINRAIKVELEENEELRAIYGNQVGERWTDQQFVLRNGVVFSAKSAGQSLRGIKYRSLRPDYILVDDLYDEAEISNIEATKKVNAWFWGTLYPSRAKARRSAIHVLGTAANKADILEQLKTKPRWRSATFRAITDHDKKQVLWPELNSYDSLMAEAADMPSVMFNREYQNERRDDSESLIKQAWIRYYDPATLTFDDGHKLVAVLLGVDPSIGAVPADGKKPKSDFTGAVLAYQTRWADAPPGVFNYYIAGAWNERLSLNKRVELLQRIQAGADRPITKAKIEGIAGFKDFVSEAKRLTNIPIEEVGKVKDKMTNLENKSGYFENGRVFISEGIDPKMRELLVDQLTTNNPTHDDLRDAVLLVLPELQRKQRWIPA